MKKKMFAILVVLVAVCTLPSCGEEESFTELVVDATDQQTITDDEDDGDIEPENVETGNDN